MTAAIVCFLMARRTKASVIKLTFVGLFFLTIFCGPFYIYTVYLTYVFDMEDRNLPALYSQLAWIVINRAHLGATMPVSDSFVEKYNPTERLCEPEEIAVHSYTNPSSCLVVSYTNLKCSYWWLPRRCAVVATNSAVLRQQEALRAAMEALTSPCVWLSNPRTKKSPHLDAWPKLLRIDPVIQPRSNEHRYWDLARCDSKLRPQELDVLVVLVGTSQVDPKSVVAAFHRPYSMVLGDALIEMKSVFWRD